MIRATAIPEIERCKKRSLFSFGVLLMLALLSLRCKKEAPEYPKLFKFEKVERGPVKMYRVSGIYRLDPIPGAAREEQFDDYYEWQKTEEYMTHLEDVELLSESKIRFGHKYYNVPGHWPFKDLIASYKTERYKYKPGFLVSIGGNNNQLPPEKDKIVIIPNIAGIPGFPQFEYDRENGRLIFHSTLYRYDYSVNGGFFKDQMGHATDLWPTGGYDAQAGSITFEHWDDFNLGDTLSISVISVTFKQ
jgi:hypothetical protein